MNIYIYIFVQLFELKSKFVDKTIEKSVPWQYRMSDDWKHYGFRSVAQVELPRGLYTLIDNVDYLFGFTTNRG